MGEKRRESLLDILAEVKDQSPADELPVHSRAAVLQERLHTVGLSSTETMEYVRVLDALGHLLDARYLLGQPLGATPPPDCLRPNL